MNLGDIVLAKIAIHEFFGFITGALSSKRITLPLKIFSVLPFGKIEVRIETLPKRKPKITIQEQKLDLYNSLPNKNKHFNWPLAVINRGNKILVWSPQAYSWVIPRYLNLDEELFEVFGLFQGEGYKRTPIGGTRVGFVNSDPEIINKFIGFFDKKFEIPVNKWSAFINYACDPNNPKRLDSELLQYWVNKTKIPLSNFKRVNHPKSKQIRSAEYGTLHIFIPSCVLGEICLSVLDIMENMVVKREDYASWFLRGLMAADGFATLVRNKHYKTLGVVGLALETEHEKKLYYDIMNKLNLKVKDYSISERKLCVCGWEDFFNLAKIDIFKLSKHRNAAFKEGFLNHKQTRMIIKYLYPLLKKEMDLNELFSKIKSKSKGSLHQTLKVQMKRNLIKKVNKQKRYKYSLTKEGRESLEFLLQY